MRILHPIRHEISSLCEELSKYTEEDAATPNERAHAILIKNELSKECPEVNLVLRWLSISGMGVDVESDDGNSYLWHMAEDLDVLVKKLHALEVAEIHSLQQEASLASTGPKSSLDH